jgi:oligopeptide transport system permease protein
MFWVFASIAGFMLLVTLIGPLLAPYDPTAFHWQQGNLPPFWAVTDKNPGDPVYLLGTDLNGRDNFSRLIFGTRTTMLLALISVPLAALLGTTVGITAGYLGGRTDNLLMRASELFGALPAILFTILIMLIFRQTPFGKWLNGMGVLVLAFFLVGWVSLARLVRGAVLTIKQELFVEAARATGVRERRILFKYILPNILGLVIIWCMAAIPRVIILEALLGYIGIGITPDIEEARFVVTSWGGLFLEGRQAINSNPVRLVAPAILVILASVSFTMLGDELRDTLDPRLNRLG